MKRQRKNLSHALEHQAKMYALAATAAGAGVLALAQPTEAKIIFTHVNHVIEPKQHYNLDLNHDGIVDFSFYNESTLLGHHSVSVTVTPTGQSNEILGVRVTHTFPNFAAALPPGARIGPKPLFGKSHSQMMYCSNLITLFCTGPWYGPKSAYLGLKFTIKGKIHYGWARLGVKKLGLHDQAHVTLFGYAYETIPNKPIIAGKTHGKDEATLGHLATGASAIPAGRVKPTAATSH
jgi:hypothetical protein